MTTIMTQMVAKVIFVPALVVAAATLVKGYADTGDGFTAGVIAALAVLLQFVAFGEPVVERYLPIRLAPRVAMAGIFLTLIVAFVPVALRRPVLTHAPSAEAEVVYLGTVELITAVVFDIGVFLLVFGFAVTSIGLISRTERMG